MHEFLMKKLATIAREESIDQPCLFKKEMAM